jgi:hypothetical protein
LVECGLLTTLLKDYSEFFLTEAAVSLFKDTQLMKGCLFVWHKEEVAERDVWLRYFVQTNGLIFPD